MFIATLLLIAFWPYFFKMQRWLEKGGSKSVERLHDRVLECHAIYFDGKRGECLFNNAGHLSSRIEDQYAVLAYPNEEYLGYVVSGAAEEKGKDIALELKIFLEKFKFRKESILALGGDGCSTNTGMWSGAFHSFEKVWIT